MGAPVRLVSDDGTVGSLVIERVRIQLSSDEMRAFLHVVAGDPIGADELRAALTRAGVTFGIDVSTLERVGELCRDGAFGCEAVPIAAGRPMQYESTGACELALAVGLQPGHQLEDGSFDYRDRGLLTPVKRGQLVARCQPAVAGVDGRTVTDRVVPFEKAAANGNPSFGDGLTRDRSGAVVADRDGVVQRADGPVIHIGDHYVHEGDVDIRSGHLAMHGSLTVTGEVTAKFEVQATGDVQIDKAIARGTVYSGGNLSVRAGIVGSTRGSVLAEGDIAAEHAQTASIRCGGTLHLRRAAVNCELHAERVRIDGAVRGGWIHAEHEIVVGEAGARIGGETVLVVGVEVERPLRLRFEEERRERHLVDRMGARIVHTRGGERRRRDDVGEDVDATDGRSDRLHALVSGAGIDVIGTIHAGTTIVFGPHRLVVDDTKRHVRFSIDPETQAIRSDPLP